MSTPSETIRTATIQASRPSANSAIFSLASGSSEVATTASTPCRARSSSAIPRAWSTSMAITRPPAVGSCRAAGRAARGPGRARSAATRRRGDSAVRSRCEARVRSRLSSNVADTIAPSGVGPLHVAVEARGRTRGGRRRRRQRLAVPVGVVGDRLVEGVLDERDRVLVGPERRAGQAEAPGRDLERGEHAVAPGALGPGVVDLVEHHEGVVGHAPQRPRVARHLLVGHHDPVHVVGPPAGGVPLGLEVQPELPRRGRPLVFRCGSGRPRHPPVGVAARSRTTAVSAKVVLPAPGSPRRGSPATRPPAGRRGPPSAIDAGATNDARGAPKCVQLRRICDATAHACPGEASVTEVRRSGRSWGRPGRPGGRRRARGRPTTRTSGRAARG
jgi:hypothetical protein